MLRYSWNNSLSIRTGFFLYLWLRQVACSGDNSRKCRVCIAYNSGKWRACIADNSRKWRECFSPEQIEAQGLQLPGTGGESQKNQLNSL